LAGEPLHKHYVPAFDCYCLFAGPLEFIIPASPESVVARSLERRGEGIHHLALHVDDLEAALKAFAADELVDAEPKAGAGAMRVAFVKPRVFAGVLIELVEEHDAGPRLVGRTEGGEASCLCSS
jgi:4-hydroxyphenylpyruvate dioxygenase-like putative hemolysin